MQIFDPSVFRLSPNIRFIPFTVNDIRMVRIENFYEDLDAVNRELDKIPYVWLKGVYEEFQNIHYQDLRQSYSSNMPGTELSYLHDRTLINQLSQIFDRDASQLEISPNLIVNAWRQNPENCAIFKDHYYAVHHDKEQYASDPYFVKQHVVVIYLNKKYAPDDGTNLYSLDTTKHKIRSLFTPKHTLELMYFHQAQPNSAIIYESNIYHNQTVSNSMNFVNEFRKTQVLWVALFSNPIPSVLSVELPASKFRYI